MSRAARRSCDVQSGVLRQLSEKGLKGKRQKRTDREERLPRSGESEKGVGQRIVEDVKVGCGREEKRIANKYTSSALLGAISFSAGRKLTGRFA
jgi:hypothetical protein